MTGTEAALANAAAIEAYGNVMKSKDLHARANCAYAKAKKIPDSLIDAPLMFRAA